MRMDVSLSIFSKEQSPINEGRGGRAIDVNVRETMVMVLMNFCGLRHTFSKFG